MKILVVGSGAREHALVWKLAGSPRVERVYCAPGNAGIAQDATCVDILAEDVEGLRAFARDNAIDLTVVGPEGPLMLGIAEAFADEGLACFAPTSRAAAIEGSKTFAKDLMLRAGVPTADHAVFTDEAEAIDWIRAQDKPLVVKADGLAAGKGVVVADSVEETEQAVRAMLGQARFGSAGARVLLEERLTGPEVSVLCFTDGETVRPMVWSQDHKRALEGDKGPNTGGMGAYSPPPACTDALQETVRTTILEPVVRTLAQEDRPYVGVLYAGLMLTDDGPKVLEFNARFGDPETQVVLLRLTSDLASIMESCLAGTLAETDIEWSDEPACGVVLASGGYPGPYEKGKPITGLLPNPAHPDEGQVVVFHAGTAERDGRVVTAGGRVLTVCARARTLREALRRVYAHIPSLSFDGMVYRRDIAHRALDHKD